jgi:hypothetical protein
MMAMDWGWGMGCCLDLETAWDSLRGWVKEKDWAMEKERGTV